MRAAWHNLLPLSLLFFPLPQSVPDLGLNQAQQDNSSVPGLSFPIARPTSEAFGKGFFTAFADGFPYLLASESSLRELNRRLADKGESALPMTRFRPNIVVMERTKGQDSSEKTGATEDKEQEQLIPFVEDTWDIISFVSSTAASDADQAPVR